MTDASTICLTFLFLFLQGLHAASTNGFLSQSEVETAAESNEGKPSQDRLQYLFPSISFTEPLSITAWSFVATRNSTNEALPQLQVWRLRSLTSSGRLFGRIDSVGSSSLLQGSGLLYRYVLQLPIHILPGDALGIFIPQEPALTLHFRDVGVGNTSTYYYDNIIINFPIGAFTIFTNSFQTGSRLIPLIAVQFERTITENIHTDTTVLTPVPLPPSSTIVATASQMDTTIILPTMDNTTPTASSQNNTTTIMMSVAIVVLVVLLAVLAVVLLGLIIFVWRRKYSKQHVVQHPGSNNTDEQVELQQNICHKSINDNNSLEDHPQESTIYDEIDQQQDDHTRRSDEQIQLQQNVCYAATGECKNHDNDESNNDYTEIDEENIYYS